MKYLVCGGILIGFTYIGMCIRSKLTAKHQFLNQLCQFIEDFLINVTYTKMPLEEYIKSKDCTSGFNKFLLNYYNYRTNKTDIKPIIKNFSEAEANQVFEFLDKIGATDSSGQIEILSNYKIIFANLLNSSCEKKQKYGSLAIKMSVLIGLLVVLLCV